MSPYGGVKSSKNGDDERTKGDVAVLARSCVGVSDCVGSRECDRTIRSMSRVGEVDGGADEELEEVVWLTKPVEELVEGEQIREGGTRLGWSDHAGNEEMISEETFPRRL